jgi:hypothetical protein
MGTVFGMLIVSTAAGADASVASPEAIVIGFQGSFRFAALILGGAIIASVFRFRKGRSPSSAEIFLSAFQVGKKISLPNIERE